MEYSEAVNYIHSLSRFGSKPGLDIIGKLLELMGNPQENLKIIHIAGTNGKGSHSSAISKVLTTAGYKTGLFISPFIEEFNERVQINDKPVSNEIITEAIKKVKKSIDILLENGEENPTEFEAVTAMGFWIFKKENIDIAIIEVGLGGRLDATNIIKRNELTVLTSISLDHTAILGNTIEKIAAEKAGIIKENSIVVSYPQKENVKEIFFAKAKEKNAEIFFAKEDDIIKEKIDIDGLHLKMNRSNLFNLETFNFNLPGNHQVKNLTSIILALEKLKEKGYKIKKEHILKAFNEITFIGRFEVYSKNPIIILDGGHNPEGIEAFSENIKELFKDKKITLFFGMLADKNINEAIKTITPLADTIYTITPPNPRALGNTELAEMINSYTNKAIARPIKNNEEIIKILSSDKSKVFAFSGSLYLIGEIRKLLKENNSFLNNL